MPILYNIYKKKGFFKIPVGGTQTPCDCSFSYSAASYKTSDSDPTPTITGDSGGVFSSTAGLVINSVTGEITLATSTVASYVVTYRVCGKSCTYNLEVTAGAIANVYSMEFDGVDDYMKVGSTAASADISVSFWMKANWKSFSQICAGAGIFTYFSSGSNPFDPVLMIYDPSGYAWREVIGGTPFDNNWHHIVITLNSGTKEVKGYIDGVLDSTTTFTSTWASNTVTLIGQHGGVTRLFEGLMDEFAVFDYKLELSDVTEIYNATDFGTDKCADLSSMTTPPVAWYRMGD